MAIRIFTFIFFFGSLLLASLLFHSAKKDEQNSMLFANPLLYRALEGYLHTLSADRLWLASNSVSELGKKSSYDVDKDEFSKAFETIAVMDPYFFLTINYGATYLASIQNDLDRAVALIDRALLFNDEDFRLLFLKMILLATYARNDIDMLKAQEIAKKLVELDSKKIFLNLKVDDLIEDLYMLASSKNARAYKEIEDLIWLYKNSKNEAVKEKILLRLKELGVEERDIQTPTF